MAHSTTSCMTVLVFGCSGTKRGHMRKCHQSIVISESRLRDQAGLTRFVPSGKQTCMGKAHVSFKAKLLFARKLPLCLLTPPLRPLGIPRRILTLYLAPLAASTLLWSCYCPRMWVGDQHPHCDDSQRTSKEERSGAVGLVNWREGRPAGVKNKLVQLY